jgi:UDP-glucose 4-epimerase
MAHCLVTGGAGFIGSHLTEHLLDLGHSVVVLDDLSGSAVERVDHRAALTVGSIVDEPLVNKLFIAESFDWVFHLAAFAAEAISHTVKRHNYETNVIGSVNLINASVRTGVSFFGFASSVGVYGHGRVPMREADWPVPADSYGIAKLMVERELDVTMQRQSLPYTAMRMHNVYGEWQNMRDPYRNAVAIFINQILRDEPITVYGDGQQVRAFTYVGDIVPLFVRAAEQPSTWGGVFNIGANQTNTVLELVEHVRCAMGVPGHPVAHLPRRDEVAVAYTDNSLARAVFGGWADRPLAEGIARTAAWARSQGSVELRPSFDLELSDEHLPEWARLVEQRLGRLDPLDGLATDGGRAR